MSSDPTAGHKIPNYSALDEALVDARQKFIDRNPESLKLHERASRFLPGGNTRTVLYYDPFPLTFVSGEGCWLEDADGHRYLDFLGEFTAGIFGHSDPVIRQAVIDAMSNGINLGGHGPLEARLGDLVCSRFPSIERVRFANSGTEANLLAIALAKAFTKREKIIVFDGAYHGSLLTFGGGGGSPVNVPHQFVIAPFNGIEETQKLIRQQGDDLAAVLVEPMQGSAGCIPGDPEFLAMLRSKTTATGSLLIFDEVMTSRLSPGGRQQQLDIRPDLTTLGKYIGGGMSFGAFGGRSEIMDLFDPARSGALPHAGTFNNNVLTMAAGVAALSEVYTPEAAQALNARGDALREALNRLFRETGLPFVATGLGSLIGLHPTPDTPNSPDDLAACDPAIRELVFLDLLEDGVYLARRGLIALSLPIGDAEVETFLDAMRARSTRWRDALGIETRIAP